MFHRLSQVLFLLEKLIAGFFLLLIPVFLILTLKNTIVKMDITGTKKGKKWTAWPLEV